MSDARPLPADTKVAGTTIWSRFLIAGALLYVGGLTLMLSKGRAISVGPPAAPLAALGITLALLFGFAVWYWVSVESIAGTRSGAWSWPDVATLSVDLDPARPLRRVQTLAEEAISWLQSSLNDSQLTLTSKGWWGNASVQVAVTPDGGGTQLRLRAGSRVLANNLIARAVIARVVEEIATKPEWTQP